MGRVPGVAPWAAFSDDFRALWRWIMGLCLTVVACLPPRGGKGHMWSSRVQSGSSGSCFSSHLEEVG